MSSADNDSPFQPAPVAPGRLKHFVWGESGVGKRRTRCTSRARQSSTSRAGTSSVAVSSSSVC
jgi:hypothetical protein